MLKIKNKEQPNRAVLLSNVDEDEEFSINNIEKQQKSLSSDNKDTKPLKICSINFTWKCICLASILTTLITIIIILIVIFTYILPHIAQNSINYATMDIINGTMYNPTNSTITLNATIQVSNTGMFSGIIPPITSTVSNDNIKIGTMQMPQIKTVANQPTIISITTVLYVTNSTQFKKSTKQLMQNIDQIWKISANNLKISVDSGIIGTLRFTVNLNKDLRLPGIHLYDFVASNFDANSATNVSINAISDLDFVSDTILTLILPMILLQMYTNNVYIGYIVMNNLTIKRGHNIIKNQQIVVDSNGINNGDEISSLITKNIYSHFSILSNCQIYLNQIMSNVSTVYKMYYKTKGFKPSKTQHLLQFGKSVHIKVKWSEANQLMKKGVTYLNSLLTADELQNITLPQEEKIQTINIKVTDGMTDYYIIKNLTLNSTIEDICSKLEPRLQQSAVKINLYRCNTLLPRSQTISQLNLRDGDSISLGVCDTSIGMDLFQSNYEITINENNSPSPDAITNVSTTNSISEQEDGTDLSVGNECITGECIELINDLLMIFDV